MAAVTNETLLRYCEEFYDGMLPDAKADEQYDKVWEGYVTRFYSSLNLSNAHYSRIMHTLTQTGCIQILRKGARGTTTLIALHARPTAELVEGVTGLQADLTKPEPPDTLSQRVRQLERRLEGIDVKALFAHLNDRVGKVERAVGKD